MIKILINKNVFTDRNVKKKERGLNKEFHRV
jgi:hypothetical protein